MCSNINQKQVDHNISALLVVKLSTFSMQALLSMFKVEIKLSTVHMKVKTESQISGWILHLNEKLKMYWTYGTSCNCMYTKEQIKMWYQLNK